MGIGGGGFSLRIAERAVTPTFDEVLENPAREINMTAGDFLFNFALGLDYWLTIGEDGKGGLLFGVRVGYSLSPSEVDWKMTDMDVLGGLMSGSQNLISI